MGVDKLLIQCRPAVDKTWLILVAGLLWTGVGIMLLNLAVGWLLPLGLLGGLPYLIAGLLLAMAIFFFGFSKLADRNLGRIELIGSKKACIFAFQEWKHYPLILFMIALGITMRHLLPIPKPYLAIIYFGIGGGLFVSSLRYYGHIWNGRTAQNPPDA